MKAAQSLHNQFALNRAPKITHSRIRNQLVKTVFTGVGQKPLSLKKACEFESIALLLQGGGALGAYQGGVYQALTEADIEPNWIGGISIGAVTGAIIAGNTPANRVPRLRGFWEHITSNPLTGQHSFLAHLLKAGGDAMRIFWGQLSAGTALTSGVAGFFTPHPLPPWCCPPGSPWATSYYDTDGFRQTLEKFIDFNLLNSAGIRYTTGAVNVRTGNFTVFDTTTQQIGPEHVMASGALPPALPAVEIEGQYFWDGGLVSNTPLQWVVDETTKDTLVFQVDLWSSRGRLPSDIPSVMTRQKEIQYSSRTRAVTDHARHDQHLRHTFATLYDKLPANLKKTDEAQLLHRVSNCKVYNIVHLIYRAQGYEGFAKDFEFSRPTMEDHWAAGYKDTVRSLRHKEVLKRPTCAEGIVTFDLTRD
jgi:NTE family protein